MCHCWTSNRSPSARHHGSDTAGRSAARPEPRHDLRCRRSSPSRIVYSGWFVTQWSAAAPIPRCMRSVESPTVAELALIQLAGPAPAPRPLTGRRILVPRVRGSPSEQAHRLALVNWPVQKIEHSIAACFGVREREFGGGLPVWKQPRPLTNCEWKDEQVQLVHQASGAPGCRSRSRTDDRPCGP